MSQKLPPKKGATPAAPAAPGAVRPDAPASPQATGQKPDAAPAAKPAAPKIFSSGGPKPPKGKSPVPQATMLSKAVPFGSQVPKNRDPKAQALRDKAEAELIQKTAPIEERALALPGVAEASSKLFYAFVENVSPKLRVRKTSAGILEAFSSIDVKAEKVGAILGENPYYESIFMKVIDALGSKRENVKPEAAVILLGMQNSRNLILALQTLRNMTSDPPEWTKEGKLKVNPADVLKFALKTEESLAGARGSHADTAYAGGYVFDLVMQVSEALSQDKKKVASYVEQTFNHGLKTAQVGAELVKSLPDFNYIKYVYSGCLIHDIGKALMAIVDPTYLDFAEKCQQKGIPRAIRFQAETMRFGVNHAVMGALCCEYTRVFKPISRSVLFHHDPHLLQGQKSHWQLAALICLATNIASNFKKTDNPEDPAVQAWKTPELRDFNLDLKAIFQAVARVN